MSTVDRVLGALGEVYDPELDEPITDLRFVTSCDVSPDGDVDVKLRLPTPQCAPNFAFLMVSDARAAILRVPGVRTVHVLLEDHYTGREINEAVDAEGGFEAAFPGEGTERLEALRSLFHRKALVARQWRIYERLVASGERPGEVAAWLLAELPAGDRDVRRCDELRRALGLDVRPEAPAFVRPDGSPISAPDLDRWRRSGRLINTSLETNGGMCRSLLEHRHHLAPEGAHA